ncbi:DUF4328 domain-containing protein [Streptomyces sp. NPDC047043]|uniref:DUF4328 domain-containing protein n=1 Tax=Streptomyces sp. NPDC047043 TaxID=3154497 RepID=UPI0033EA41F7
MNSPLSKAPLPLARCTQAVIPVAAVADVFRALAVRAHRLHPTDASLNRSGFASMVFVYLTTAAIVLFLVWFSRCRRNAQVLSPGAVTGSGAWAVLAWLIPMVNLWVPRGLVLEVQRASSADTTTTGRDEVLVNVWWAAWAGHTVLTAASQLGGGTSLPLLVVAEVLEIAAAVLVVLVIQRITTLQSRALAAGSPVAPLTPAA